MAYANISFGDYFYALELAIYGTSETEIVNMVLNCRCCL